MSEAKHTPLPWSSTANSWQYTTLYDKNGTPICRLDLDDWGVTEDNQDTLEKQQTEVAALIVSSVNSLPDLVKALEEIAAGSSIPITIAKDALTAYRSAKP